MNPLGFPLLADENIHPQVIMFLQQAGYTIQSLKDADLLGKSDLAILHHAQRAGQVVLTHDSDFGTLVIAQKKPFIGVVYLRPGHIDPEFTVQSLKALALKKINVQPSFIVVIQHREQTVHIRVRQL